jgi:hypothetical protein
MTPVSKEGFPMTQTIGFPMVQAYLDAVAAANGTLPSSPHQDFWNVPYNTFITGNVPGVSCQSQPVPIINTATPLQSPFYLIMTTTTGWCGMKQMPKGGPFITVDTNQFPLVDGSGTTASGKQIREDLGTWLANGYPKDPKTI